jgi:sulfur carrier protein ThiS
LKIELKIMLTRRQALGLEPTGPKVATKIRKARVTKTVKVKPTVHEVLVEAGLEDEEDEPTGFVINVNDSPVPFHASSDEDEP